MRKYSARRLLVMAAGIVVMGLGVALFRLSLMGNDPINGMYMAIADRLGFPFYAASIGGNCALFALEAAFGRRYVGPGTFVNWIGVGTITTFFRDALSAFAPQGFAPRLAVMAAGVLVLSLSVSLYQTADVGISPYDSLSIILSDRLHAPYFWCRIFTDSICTVVLFAFGGILGVGTLICALGLGPFIAFFDRTVSKKLCKES